MPMIDVYAAVGTLADKHTLAADLARTLMTIEQVPRSVAERDRRRAILRPDDQESGLCAGLRSFRRIAA
jgi:hypothetical protein